MEQNTGNQEIFDVEKSPMREAYHLLGATTPLELSQLYTKQDQLLFIPKTWDYNNPDQIQNKIKTILENMDETGLTEDEKEWRNEILWFWYHHAISCANWKQEKEKMKEFSAKALQYQDNPNILTRTMFLLAHDRMDEAEEWVQSKEGDDDHENAVTMINEYKEHGHW
jgi:hypothetical protein